MQQRIQDSVGPQNRCKCGWKDRSWRPKIPTATVGFLGRVQPAPSLPTSYRGRPRNVVISPPAAAVNTGRPNIFLHFTYSGWPLSAVSSGSRGLFQYSPNQPVARCVLRELLQVKDNPRTGEECNSGISVTCEVTCGPARFLLQPLRDLRHH